MDTFIILSKYTSQGWQYATPKAARARWDTIANSLKNTLKGQVLSHHVTMGGYDSVVIFAIPPNQDFELHKCLTALQQPGDVEITVLRAWEFDKFAPPQQRDSRGGSAGRREHVGAQQWTARSVAARTAAKGASVANVAPC